MSTPATDGSGPVVADLVVDAPNDTGVGFGDARRAVNGVRGGGSDRGSLDVYSLGYDEDYLVLGWSEMRVADGPGEDLAVFENAFTIGEGPLRFMDPAIVEVSRDGATWVAFPHDFVAEDETRYSADPASWVGFAGITPVLLHAEDNPVDPFDRAAAGGDGFDLADLPDTEEADRIRLHGAAFVRIVAAASRDNPDTGAPFVRDPSASGPDLDGVVARHLVPEAP